MKPTAKFRIEGEDATALAFRQALGNAEGTAKRMQAAFKYAFAGISVAAVAGVAARSIELGDNLDKAATKAGITGRAMSELAHFAKMSDIELDALSTSIKKMQVNLSEAATGAKGPTEALSALGLKIQDIKGLKADEQFELIADRISKLQDPLDRTRAAVDIFGKAGADLLPAFEKGAAGIRAAREEAQRLGVSFSDEQIKKLADADRAIKAMKASWEGFATTLTASVAPALTSIFDILSGKGLPHGGLTGDMAKDEIIAEIENAIRRKQANPEMNSAAMQTIIDRDIADLYAKIERLKTRNEPGRGRGNAAIWAPGYESVADQEAAEKAAIAAQEERIKLADRLEIATRKQHAAEADHYESLQELTRTAGEQQVRTFETAEAALVDLLEAGKITSETYAARMAEALDALNVGLEDVEVTAKRVGKAFETEMDLIPEYADRAARSAKDSLEEFLFKPSKAGFKGMLADFVDTMRHIAAEQAALSIFGEKGSGGLGDLVRIGVGAIFGGMQYGGGKAMGGPLEQGKWYTAGEHGPEPIWGGGPGAFAAGYRGGGATHITVTNHVDARGATQDVIKALPAILEANNKQVVEAAKLAVRDDMSRRGRA